MHLKKSSFCVIATLILFSFQAISQVAEEAAIKKTIADETAAYNNRDAEAWKTFFLQDDKTSRIYNGWRVSRSRTGWAAFSDGIIKFIKENPKPDTLNITTDSFLVKREGNMAVVEYKQHLAVPNAQPPFDKSDTRETRVLIKKNGKWLITSMTTTDLNITGPNGFELALNEVGYDYIFAGKNDEAVKVLELNSVLFPDSYNTWDSLGEAYAKVGNKEKAIACYEKSLAIYPGNESGKKALAELK